MKQRRKTLYLCLALSIIFLMPGIAKEEDAKSYIAKVQRVVDGDTILLENGQKVRYIGIDCPETKHPKKLPEPFGFKAWEYNQELVGGKDVFLTFDIQRTDRYGRTLAYVFAADIFINARLIKEGYARVTTFPPNTLYEELFKELEREAKEQKRGLWKK